jgi:hypothetical protein
VDFFFVCVEGTLYPKRLVNTPLLIRTDPLVLSYKQKPTNAFITLPINKELFLMNKEDAFRKMYILTYPFILDEDNRDPNIEDVVADYKYKASTSVMEQLNQAIFVVSDGISVRVLGGELQKRRVRKNLKYCLSNKVDECVLPIEKVKEMTARLENFLICLNYTECAN